MVSNPKFYVMDLETMLNCFLFGGKFVGDPQVQQFEISSRVNQRTELLQWLGYLQSLGVVMVGYNSVPFDYEILHVLLTQPYTFDFNTAYNLAQSIIKNQNSSGANRIRFSDRIIPQLDLLLLNHFNNHAKHTSLKALQFAMRSESVEDLPFPFNQMLESWQMDVLRSYHVHDLFETEKFFHKCEYAIKIRQELIENGVLSGDVLNYSDVKIGTEYICRKLGRGKCYISGSTPRQTLRNEVELATVILPKIQFRTEEFQSVHEWFKKQIIYTKSNERPHLEEKLADLPFHFGVGGVHASVENKVYRTTDTRIIKDIDVSGMYPAVAIANGFAPEHLGQDFVNAYRQMSLDRKQHPKGSAMNLVLKLANNGAFGNAGNEYSFLYDLKFLYSITINGQLQLLQLVEMLSLIPGVELIQANTDGITAYVPREVEHFFDLWCNEWECITGLKLEHVPYKRMWISDVNNYLAEGMDGKIKRKGKYWYPIKDEDYQGSSGSNWNKDFSNLSTQKIAECCMVKGYQPADALRLISSSFDLMLRYKTPAGAKVFIGDREQQRTVRYYVSVNGEKAKKVSIPKYEIGTWKRRNSLKDDYFNKILSEIPPGAWDERIHTKNKKKNEMVETSIESGWLIKQCNKASEFNWSDVDWRYYEQEINKLLIQ